MDWRVAGHYLESCNCDAICPCRMINGVPGGRSTHGVCYGVLGWRIEEGHCGEIELGGLATALVIRYYDDEPGSPWSIVLHLDEHADENQAKALEDIFLGRLGGRGIVQLPWVRKPSHVLDVRVGAIEIEGGGLRVGTSVRLATQPYATDADVRCVIPGYDRHGTELVADELVVDDDPFSWELAGNCAYVSDFDYASEETSPTGQETPVPPIPQ